LPFSVQPRPPAEINSTSAVVQIAKVACWCKWARSTLGMTSAAITANTTMNSSDNHRSTRVMVAWPRKGITNCSATAKTMNTILSPVPEWIPPRPNIATRTSTMSARPSISKPTWVIQLNSAGARLPLRPKDARLTIKAVVPVSGPCRLARPSKT
jgi:hypothetical protein